jgi:hypothetical protein
MWANTGELPKVQTFNSEVMTMGDSNSVLEFGFDDAKIIKTVGVETFKQNRPGEKHRVSIIAFKKFHDEVLIRKTREKGSPLTDEEKAALYAKVDQKLAEQLKKPAEQLTEADRLEIRKPKFSVAFTHFHDGVGTIRCLSRHEGSTMVKPEECCNRFGDADQKVGTVIMTYPIDEKGQVDADLLKMRKYTSFYVWVLSAKKFKKLEAAYTDAKNDKREVIDLRVTLDGDPKFQKQQIEAASTAFWAREDCDPEIRAWVLDQGLRAYKHVGQNLGFEMKLDKLMEKLAQLPGGGGNAPSAQISAGTQADAPKLVQSYEDLLGG